MTDPDELRQALSAVGAALAQLSVRWAIGGSLASAAHGEPRATNAVDVVAAVDVDGARRFADLLGRDFYVDADVAADAARRRSSFNVIDQRSFLKIDVFVPGPGALGVGQLDRVRELDLFADERPVPVLGPEDVVIQKLRWYQLGGAVSERQWRDVVSVLRAVDDLDDTYLDAVASSAGLHVLLTRAREDAAA